MKAEKIALLILKRCKYLICIQFYNAKNKWHDCFIGYCAYSWHPAEGVRKVHKIIHFCFILWRIRFFFCNISPNPRLYICIYIYIYIGITCPNLGCKELINSFPPGYMISEFETWTFYEHSMCVVINLNQTINDHLTLQRSLRDVIKRFIILIDRLI